MLKVIATLIISFSVGLHHCGTSIAYASGLEEQQGELNKNGNFHNKHTGAGSDAGERMVMALAIGYVATISILSCQDTTSLSYLAFFAGGLAVLAGEIIANKEQREASEAEVSGYDNSSKSTSESFMAASRAQMKQSEAEQTRADYWRAASTAFYAAGLLAFTEFLTTMMSLVGCGIAGGTACSFGHGGCCVAVDKAFDFTSMVATVGSLCRRQGCRLWSM
jgi:hypothetical protein